jgi:hypothetical protein
VLLSTSLPTTDFGILIVAYLRRAAKLVGLGAVFVFFLETKPPLA